MHVVTQDPKKLVVEFEDLEAAAPTGTPTERRVPNAPRVPDESTTQTRKLPALPPLPVGQRVTVPSVRARLGANGVIAGLIAGSVGGAVAAGSAQLFRPQGGLSALEPTDFETGIRTALLIGLIGLVLGFGLASWEGFTSRSRRKGVIDGTRGAALGFAAGFVSGAAALGLYSSLGHDMGTPTRVAARGATWMLFGGLIGLGLGLGRNAAVSGLLGGSLGGACAGTIFELLAVNRVFASDGPLRLIGLVVTGAGIGMGIGLVERIWKDAWLRIIAGPMRGKEVILTKPTTLVGADHRADLVLAKDSAVSRRHLVLTRNDSGLVTARPGEGGTLMINGQSVSARQLRTGDEIAVGTTVLCFEHRAVK